MPTINTTPVRIYFNKGGNDISDSKKNVNKIYNSTTYRNLRKARLIEHPVCEICNKNLATDVHHVIPIPRDADELTMKTYGLDPNNLIALCNDCHHNIHRSLNNDKFYESRD
jgi:5-methylcytosine-specific restriction endonuclease McrA